MGALKTCFLFALVCLVVADDSGSGLVPPGPPGTTTITPPTSSTSSSTSSTTTSTTPRPTTSSTTSSTSKPTTTTSTIKPTTSSPAPTTPPTTSSSAKPITTSSTSKPTTPTTPAPTPKPTPPAPVDPIGTWFVNYTNTNRTCLLLKAELSIDIYYKVDNATKNITVNIPSNAPATGLCGALAENITLSLGAPDAISFNLRKSNDSKRYDVESVIVLLTRNVPGRNDSVFSLVHAKNDFSTPVSNSYKCAKEQKLNLTAQAVLKDYEGVLRVSHFQIQAFRNASSTKFDEALDCASSETPDVVPIAVGCALAALVVIVLIAYLIGRRRSQARGYLSM